MRPGTFSELPFRGSNPAHPRLAPVGWARPDPVPRSPATERAGAMIIAATSGIQGTSDTRPDGPTPLTQAELDRTLDLHGAFLKDRPGGMRADLRRRELSGLDLAGRDLSGANLGGAILTGCILRGSRISHACLFAADLRGANLEHAEFRRSDLRGACLREARLTDALFVEADLRSGLMFGLPDGDEPDPARFVAGNPAGAGANGGLVLLTDLSRAVAGSARFIRADLSFADLHRAELAGADFSQANLAGANVRDADLTGACLKYASLRNADLTGAVIDAVDLTTADLTGTALRRPAGTQV